MRTKILLLGGCVAIILLVLFFPPQALVAGEGNGVTTQVAPVSGSATSTVTEAISLNPVYDFFGSGSGTVNARIDITGLNLSQSKAGEVVSSFAPSSDLAIVTFTNGTSKAIPVTVISGTYGDYFTYAFVLPSSTSQFLLSISGTVGGETILWRYVLMVPSLSLSGIPTSSYVTQTLTLPSQSQVVQSFDPSGAPLSSGYVLATQSNASATVFSVSPYVDAILIQPSIFVPVSILLTIVAAALVVVIALNLFAVGKRILGKVPISGVARIPLYRDLKNLRVLERIKGLAKPRKLMTLFILCSILMAGLAVSAGPDPRLHVYVVASPSVAAQIANELNSVYPNVQVYTPSQDYIDFGVMSSVGQFDVVITSSYPTLALPTVSSWVLGGLGNVPVIVVDNNTDPTFKAQIMALDSDRVLTVGNAAALAPAEMQELSSLISENARTNLLGLQVGGTTFKLVLITEALLSFVLVFLGWAFLGSLASDPEAGSDLYHLALIVGSGVFVFVFSEMTYVMTSTMLAFPLSLHAVISGAKDITAVGILGFGGGSTPRLAAGFVGVLAGIQLSEGTQKFRKGDLALIFGLVVLLLANPFSVGLFSYEALLLFVGNITFGSAYLSSLSVKGFLYSIGAALGGGVTPTYLLSAGKILYFAGLPLLAYVKKMSRVTGALAVLLSALIIGDGGVRVGEMTPDKTVAAILPGLVAGVAIALFMVLLAHIERYIRSSRSSSS